MDAPYTPSQTVGPFFAIMLPLGSNELADPGDAGAITVTGLVRDGAGDPVTDALIELWQADGDGGGYFGRCATDANGRYSFITLPPGRLPYSDERLQAPHLSLRLFARGLLRALDTRVYFPDEPANASDPVLCSVDERRRQTLIAAPAGPRCRYQFDITLQGDGETVFFAL
jgi:protocatechuate 3,4-dioxygenase alpha subunit